MPEENPSTNPHPPFRTPNPTELQSEESKATTRETLAKEQGSETDVVDPNDTNRGFDKDEPIDQLDTGLATRPGID